MTPLIFLIALAASVPTSDPHKICLNARSAAPAADQKTAYESCIHDEETARDQLRKSWSHFSADARETCSEPGAVMTSYVEVLTCLEMENGGNFSGAAPQSSTNAPPAIEPNPPNAEGKKP
jgi:hypothetical protein